MKHLKRCKTNSNHCKVVSTTWDVRFNIFWIGVFFPAEHLIETDIFLEKITLEKKKYLD